MIATDTCPRPRAQRLTRRLAAALVVGGLIGGLCGIGAGPASATIDDDDAIPHADLQIAVGTTGQIAPEGPLEASVRIANTSTETLDAGTVTVELGSTPLTDSAAVDRWLDDGVTSGDLEPVASAPSETVRAGGGGES